MNTKISDMLKELIGREGGYVSDPKDSGGETNFGITVATARANGYTGAMKEMPRDVAERIYKREYWEKPGFAAVAEISAPVGEMLFDAGVNMGVKVAALFCQMVLNALNNDETLYADLKEDGSLGPVTIEAMNTLFVRRGAQQAETVLLRGINCMRGARYIEISRNSPKNERFVFGWLMNRVFPV